MLRRIVKFAAWAFLPPLGLIAIYALAALVCALLPFKGRAQTLAAGEPAMFVCASLAHTDVVVPLGDLAGAWRNAFPAIARDAPDTVDLAIGWGDLGFYLNTPRWRDLTAKTAFRAFAGLGPTTLHVLAVDPPRDVPSCVEIAVDSRGRAALLQFILATAANDESGIPHVLAAPRPGEAFYAAKGRYSPWRTCNQWTSEALAAAGVTTALWAPFSFGVMWPLRGEAPS